MWTPRDVCARCRRPKTVCYCASLPRVESATRVVFLQHPRERRVPVGTCRMAHLALPNSELHVGVHFDGEARLQALASAPDVAVLFPSPEAVPVAQWRGPLPRTLVVVDGTWVQAKKVLERNAFLNRLPRLGLRPTRPGNYRIRKEPAEHCLSTIEAVAEVLGELEGAPERFREMLRAFDWMVDTQLHFVATRQGPSRHKRRRRGPRTPRWSLPETLVEHPERQVLLYAEANAHSMLEAVGGKAELLQWAAVRPATGETFEAVVVPRRPLAQSAPHHLELSRERLLAGEPVQEGLARWRAFSRPTDVLCTWGRYALDLLGAEGEPERPWLDLRQLTAQLLSRRAGGVEGAVQLLGGVPQAVRFDGRAGRRLAALEGVLERLTVEARRRLRPADASAPQVATSAG